MVKISLQIKANVENVTDLRPEDNDFRWYLKLRCLNCGEVPDKWQYVSGTESAPLKGGRGSANLVSKCRLCSRENSIDIIKDSIKPYSSESQGRFKTVVTFDCRGMEPTDFSPRNGWFAKGEETSTSFSNVDLSEKEWADFDEQAKLPTVIDELEHQFVKEK